MRRLIIAVVSAALAVVTTAHANQVTTFENFGLAPHSFANDAGAGGQFVVDGNQFNNRYDPSSGSWYGWSISSTTDTTSPAYSNQYSAIVGHGADGSATYAVGFTYGVPAFANLGLNPIDPAYVKTNPFHPSDSYIALAPGTSPVSMQITNTTYTYLTLRDGDPYGFVPPFQPGDYQLLDIRGYDATGHLVGDVEFYLANYLGSNRDIVDTWKTVDLTPLAGATVLQFGIRSSLVDATYGVSTPTYFAMDNLVLSTNAVPEPAGLVMMAIGLLGSARLLVRNRRTTGVSRA